MSQIMTPAVPPNGARPAASAYIRSLQTPDTGAAAADRIGETLAHCRALPEDALPPEALMNIVGSPDAAHFRATMCDLFHELALRGGLSDAATVLDLGCGCGRLALPFAAYLRRGRYYGIDVWEEGLDWCRQNIPDPEDTLRFILREAANNYYFAPRDGTARNRFHLDEIGHEGVDFGFAISLFTHLQFDDAMAYLGELSRVMKRGGCAYLTCFLIDEFFFDYVRRTGAHRAVRQEEPGCYYAYEGQDFFAGYTRRTWDQMLENCGLRAVACQPGKWAGKPGALHYQDTFIVVPAGFCRT